MKLFICAIPLFDGQMAVQAYKLCSRSGESVLDKSVGHGRMAEALQSPGLDLVEKVGAEPFASDKKLFANINKFQLLTGSPSGKNINPQQLVCVLPGDIETSADVIECCENLKSRGYGIAIEGFPSDGMSSPMFHYIDYLVLDSRNPKNMEFADVVRRQRPLILQVITNVSDLKTYDKIKNTRNTLFSGQFYSQPITVGTSDIGPVKVNALQLLKQVNEPDFELDDIAKIIGRDPALSISLLRFINSMSRGQKIDSIQQGVAILGQLEVRRWATAAISMALAEDQPSEITRLSLVRARFAENLAGAFELGVFQESLFIAGLFSLLDVILQMPMEKAVQEVAVKDDVHKALVEKDGRLYPVLEIIYAYERADWNEVTHLMIKNNITVEHINKAFVDALTWYHTLLSVLEGEEDGLQEEEEY